jgi:hypothetical protein
MTTNNIIPWDTLCDDLYIRIFDYLDDKSLCDLSQTSKKNLALVDELTLENHKESVLKTRAIMLNNTLVIGKNLHEQKKWGFIESWALVNKLTGEFSPDTIEDLSKVDPSRTRITFSSLAPERVLTMKTRFKPGVISTQADEIIQKTLDVYNKNNVNNNNSIENNNNSTEDKNLNKGKCCIIQ